MATGIRSVDAIAGMTDIGLGRPMPALVGLVRVMTARSSMADSGKATAAVLNTIIAGTVTAGTATGAITTVTK